MVNLLRRRDLLPRKRSLKVPRVQQTKRLMRRPRRKERPKPRRRHKRKKRSVRKRRRSSMLRMRDVPSVNRPETRVLTLVMSVLRTLKRNPLSSKISASIS